MAENRQKTGGRFRKGQSGNPGGRPPLTEAQRIARELKAQLAPEAVGKLGDILRDKKTSTKDRLVAIKIALDGLEPLKVQGDLALNPFASLTPEQLAALAKKG